VPEHVRGREQMVAFQLQARDIVDPVVLEVMGRVPRHLYVPEAMRASAYEDRPLPIGEGQTISQPYIVAYMTQALDLEPGDRVLEIGTGSGYQAAVLAEIVQEVYTIEIVPVLARKAGALLSRLGYENVHVRTGNGYFGWPGEAPFDAIIVTAAPGHVPQALVDQLADGAVLVLPVGEENQELVRIRSGTAGEKVVERLLPVRFVPMTGARR
jgi:protein-L-isoaspartate(D-aspartate) O-methyltransferase